LPCVSFAQYCKLLDFSGASNGRFPYFGSLLYDGVYLYGMTSAGGTSNDGGVIFKVKPDGTGNSKLHDFGATSDGSLPYGSLMSDGNFLYGMTSRGGANGAGVVFKIQPDGSGYSILYSFTNAEGGPFGGLTYDGTFLYGMTHYGGINGMGIIFKIRQDGTGFAKLHDFDYFNSTEGARPNGTLSYDGTYLYGLTTEGGQYQGGSFFRIKPDGSEFSILKDFMGADGQDPCGSLFFDGTYFYGTTNLGGGGTPSCPSGCGTIFKIRPDGTEFANLYNFDNVNGSHPQGSLISDGTFLFGMSLNGGLNYEGVIFKLRPDGSEFTKLFDFSDTTGLFPYGDLTAVGGSVFGMTSHGGSNSYGVIFKYDIDIGIAEILSHNSGINIYPNPTSNIIHFRTESKSVYSITNSIGKEITSGIIDSNQYILNVSNYPKGIYFVKVAQGDKISTQKIVLM
jgi:uncharacterized repeat protein (TIGR03803 family)